MLSMRSIALLVLVACRLHNPYAVRLRLKGHKFGDHATINEFDGKVGKGRKQQGGHGKTPLNPIGQFSGMFHIRQKFTGLYLDSLGLGSSALTPIELVTRPQKFASEPGGFDRAQLWFFTYGKLDAYDIMQYSSGFFLEACHYDYSAKLKLPNINITDLTQKWLIQKISGGEDNEVQILQISTDRVLHAHDDPQVDDQVITHSHLAPTDSAFNRQVWILEPFEGLPPVVLNGIFSMQQMSSKRVVSGGSKTVAGNDDFAFFTENIKFGDYGQMIMIRPVKGAVVSISQSETGKLMGAHPLPPDPAKNYTVVGRPWMNSMGEEFWLVIRIAMAQFVIQHVPTGRILDGDLLRPKKGSSNLYSTRPTLAGLAGNVSSELWKISKLVSIPILSGIFRIVHKVSGYALTAPESGTAVDLRPWSGRDAQRWELKRITGDVYSVKNSGTSIALSADEEAHPDHKCHVKPEDTSDPAQQIYMATAGASNLWVFTSLKDDRWIKGRNSSEGVYETETVKDVPENNYKPFLFKLDKIGEAPCVPLLTVCSSLFECGFQDDGCGGNLNCGHHDGMCTEENTITHEKYHCHEDQHCHCTPVTECSDNTTECRKEPDGCGGSIACGGPQCAEEATTAAPAPIPMATTAAAPAATSVYNPSAWTKPIFSKPAVWGNLSSEQTNDCKTTCDPSFQCGVELDGCGSMILCGNASGACEGGSSFTCTTDHQCVCVPKAYCDVDMECGFVDDGCGGVVYCGSGEKGACSQGPNFTCTENNTCSCTPKFQCDPGIECGVQPDGCGGTVTCGNFSGSCKTGPNLNFTCSTYQQCTCTPKTTCDDGFTCGSQPDGCGGEIICGFLDGACAMLQGNNYTCVDNACECVPRNCNNVCGFIEDGCGGHKQCECSMSNQLCNAQGDEIGTCIHVAQPPPPPGIFGPRLGEAVANATVAENVTNATNTTEAIAATNATAAVNDTSDSRVSASPKTSAPAVPSQEVMRYYLFFYYFFYYLEYLKLTDAGMSEEVAAAKAGAVANDRALSLTVEVGQPANKALDQVDFMNLVVSRLMEYYTPGVSLGKVFEMVEARVAEYHLDDNSAFKVVKDM